MTGLFVHRNPVDLDLLEVVGSPEIDGVFGSASSVVLNNFIQVAPAIEAFNGVIDFDASRVARTAEETRTINSLVIPYYRL